MPTTPKNWSFGIIQFVKIILRFLEDPKVHMLAKSGTATIRPVNNLTRLCRSCFYRMWVEISSFELPLYGVHGRKKFIFPTRDLLSTPDFESFISDNWISSQKENKRRKNVHFASKFLCSTVLKHKAIPAFPFHILTSAKLGN